MDHRGAFSFGMAGCGANTRLCLETGSSLPHSAANRLKGIMIMRIRAFFIVAGAFAAIAGSAAADITCGTKHRVVRGDTLQKIVNRVYGREQSWELLYAANRDVIGRDASQLEVGMILTIPCFDEATLKALEDETMKPEDAVPLPASVATSAPEKPEPAQVKTPVAEAPRPEVKISILAASDQAPFLDEDMQGGGMLAEITSAALGAVMKESDFRIDFINDRKAHLSPLLIDSIYDLSIGWMKPDCAGENSLPDEFAPLCNSFLWSDPLYEQVTGYYTRAGEMAPDHKALMGKTLCRPSGYSTAMMDAEGLTSPAIKLERPADAESCLAMLLDGKVDAAVLATPVADAVLATTGKADQVTEQAELGSAATVHIIAYKKNVNAVKNVMLVNEGLKRIRKDGEWYKIIASALAP